jgi:hypothetical protein
MRDRVTLVVSYTASWAWIDHYFKYLFKIFRTRLNDPDYDGYWRRRFWRRSQNSYECRVQLWDIVLGTKNATAATLEIRWCSGIGQGGARWTPIFSQVDKHLLALDRELIVLRE